MDFEAVEAPIRRLDRLRDSSVQGEGTPVGSASKGRLRAEIEGRGEGRFLPPQGETKAVSWGIPLAFVKLKFEFLSEFVPNS